MAIFAILGNIGGTIGGNALGGSLGGNIGGNIGTIVGGFIDKAIFGKKNKTKNDRLELQITSSAEGLIIPRVFGSSRIAGNIIWIDQDDVEQENEEFTVSFALSLCEGPIQGVRRIWVNGEILDLSGIDMSVYWGYPDQEPDPDFENADIAYRNISYIFFRNFPLARFGNQMPNFGVEVFKNRLDDNPIMEDLVTGVSLIPASGEFIYEPTIKISQETDSPLYENVHLWEGTDIQASIEDLKRTLPHCQNILLVVSWFGTDLRCAECEIMPKVDQTEKNTSPYEWEVSQILRSQAELVSSVGPSVDQLNPAYGGTPTDKSVYNCIVWLKEQGFNVTFYPFILMDIDHENELPNPYTGTDGQPQYPWRGRITCDPAIGQPGTVDKTAAAATQIGDFFGTADVSDFGGWNGNTINYSGGDEWRFRRMILHYAKLCDEAGGVDGFIIGSEMIGLTTIRSSSSVFPAVTQFKTLADDVKSILPTTPVSYAADWSEYHSYRPNDGSDDVYFNLDPLWSHSNIDFIAIDNYLPLSDWRDGTSHLDYGAGAGQATSIYDIDYLKANVEGGEYYDWFYATPTDRINQVRTAIVDSAEGKDWVFRQKDFKNWWLNDHYNRPAGVESGSPTSWTPQSKKIIFSEFGCPTVDKGTNQPNVFVDPKSSESFYPYFSNQKQDLLIQKQYLKALYEYWNDALNNPVSSVYSDSMLDIDHSFVWTWDARPYPAYPYLNQVWSDGYNWNLGHWLTGKLGSLYLYEIVQYLCDQSSVECDITAIVLPKIVKGYYVDQIISNREIIDILIDIHNVAVIDSGGVLKFFPKLKTESVASITRDDLVLKDEKEAIEILRYFELDIPKAVNVNYINIINDYNTGSVRRETLIGNSQEIVSVNLPVSMTQSDAENIAAFMISEFVMKRDAVSLTLPLSFMYLESGDVFTLNYQDKDYLLQAIQVTISNVVEIQAVSYSAEVYDYTEIFSVNEMNAPNLNVITAIDILFLDIPTLRLLEAAEPTLPRVAVNHFMKKSYVNIYDIQEDGSKVFQKTITKKAKTGTLATDFYGKKPYKWQINEIWVFVNKNAALSANITESQVMNGGNTCLVYNSITGGWFVFQYSSHELADSATNKYRLYGKFNHGIYGTYKHNIKGDFIALDAPVIFLQGDTGLTTIPFIEADRVIDNDYSYGPSIKGSDSVYYTDTTQNFNFEFLKPYSPVHLKAARESNDDITFTWVRRSRSIYAESDWINPGDNLLGEISESYQGTIYDNTGMSPVLRRVFSASAQTFTYTAAQQAADGGIITEIMLEIGQVSAIYGLGDTESEEFDV